jgi:hypothetical protein
LPIEKEAKGQEKKKKGGGGGGGGKGKIQMDVIRYFIIVRGNEIKVGK